MVPRIVVCVRTDAVRVPHNEDVGAGILVQALRKRREILASETHFIEIDLLRVGERFPVAGPLPSAPYFVILSRSNLRPRIEVWPISIDAVLPRVPIPLLAGDPDSELDLQLAVRSVYDLYHYDADINYLRPPSLPLPLEQTEWAEKLLQEAGRR